MVRVSGFLAGGHPDACALAQPLLMSDITQLDPEFVRCYCTGVTRELAIAAVRTHGCRTVDEVKAVTGACSGCGSCRPELILLLRSLTE